MILLFDKEPRLLTHIMRYLALGTESPVLIGLRRRRATDFPLVLLLLSSFSSSSLDWSGSLKLLRRSSASEVRESMARAVTSIILVLPYTSLGSRRRCSDIIL